ncbi:MAG TPA: M2 family metallopeptidase [Vicinamibacterales bacterium]|nr:M2 family metallopeptidase [Vicinamibacterales bacterium]
MTHRLSALVVSAALAASVVVSAQSPVGAVTAEEARKFLADANQELFRLINEANRAGWVQNTYITPDTELLAARANELLVNASTKYAKEARRFDGVQLPASDRRQFEVLKNSLTMSAPPNAKEAEELTRLVASMEGAYGSGKYCPKGATGDNCLDIEKITEILAENRDPARLKEVWEGWHTVGSPMRKDYARFVELSNKGAAALDYPDTGAMWRGKYDMPADAFAKELDRLWEQLRPLYLSLHTYVRARLHDKYGAVVPQRGPIPAHLLGNLWQQDWSNIYDLVAPPGDKPVYSLTENLKSHKIEPLEMVRIGERFFTSLGFEPLPKSFWERSLFLKPRDREVVCHASAWDIDSESDVRIKMCIDLTAEDFITIHHELGHNFYQRAYSQLPVILRDSANDGFHEAVGDTLALSVTPEYLVKIGLLDKAPDASADTGLLLKAALERLAFLPFGLLVDQWRWQVFAGRITPANYNRAWWDLKLRYQGVAPPAARGEEFFDPGAKYHVPANTPYARYFLAQVLQFQFHRALTRASGCTGPLHRCSIYGSKEAGAKLKAMLEMGAAKPWPDALEALTGQRQMDATAIADYFAPLKTWLDEQNKGKSVGW